MLGSTWLSSVRHRSTWLSSAWLRSSQRGLAWSSTASSSAWLFSAGLGRRRPVNLRPGLPCGPKVPKPCISIVKAEGNQHSYGGPKVCEIQSLGRVGLNSAQLGSRWLGPARLGLLWPGSVWLSSARPSLEQLGTTWLGSVRLDHRRTANLRPRPRWDN